MSRDFSDTFNKPYPPPCQRRRLNSLVLLDSPQNSEFWLSLTRFRFCVLLNAPKKKNTQKNPIFEPNLCRTPAQYGSPVEAGEETPFLE